MLAVGILLLSSIVAVDLLLEDTPVVIQLEGDTFKVVDIPYVYTVKEAYILLFSGFTGGLALAQVLRSSGLQEPVFSLTTPSARIKVEDPQERSFEVSSDSAENFQGEGFQPDRAHIDPTVRQKGEEFSRMNS
ncbi:hypothetical protein [Methanosarcina mazei]|nr:hypothetical protein [Methanosarcina mazei]